QVLAAYPRSGGALVLAVEAEIARGGAAAGLAQYERWLGQRTLEEPAVLRQVAKATLREQAVQQQDATARAEALRALEADGDRHPVEPDQAAQKPGPSATRASAATGDERAVKALIGQLNKGVSDVRTIDALGESGSTLAIAPLVERLKEPRSEVRGAAADALGKLGDSSMAARLKPLLSDRNGYVRVKAAGALFRLGDFSGMQMLQELMADPSPELRLAAAEAMASKPDGAWTALVRELTTVSNPEIQARAARLLAPHDPESSRKVLETLAAHENPAIRDLASNGLGDVATTDLTTLRGLIKSRSRLTRVRASTRVLEVTRQQAGR
ncbi:MAG: HEAT repeat domain-containing protein, partial [Vicinamibacterales bacterium]